MLAYTHVLLFVYFFAYLTFENLFTALFMFADNADNVKNGWLFGFFSSLIKTLKAVYKMRNALFE